MSIGITDKFKPKNNGSFALMDAADVEMPDGTRLSDKDLSKGRDGLTPFIGDNGNWWIGDTDTGVRAQGEAGPQGEQGPQGEKGDTGAKGEQGEPGTKGDKGDPGEDGADGADGYSPVKGIDYYTEADKQEMVAAVIAALPTAEGVGF